MAPLQVTSREGRVSRNCTQTDQVTVCQCVTSREGRVSRNVYEPFPDFPPKGVTSREGRVSRNFRKLKMRQCLSVTSREGRVSRNSIHLTEDGSSFQSRPARGV